MYTTKYTFCAALFLIATFFGTILLALAETMGDVIVYSSGEGSITQVLSVDLRTHQNVPLVKTDNPLAPAWSPDGCQIAYHTRSGAAPGELRLLSFAEGQPVTIYDQSVGSFGPSEPDWSPDGSQLVFVGGDLSLYTLRLSDAATNKITVRRQNASSPDWSPDGDQIVFQGLSTSFNSNGEQNRAAEISTISAQGMDLRDLTNNHEPDTDPVWSPDGTRIAFVSKRDRQSADIFIMSADGTSVRHIVQAGQEADLSWSPDGTRLAFALDINGGWNLYMMDVDGTGLEQVTYDQPPAYSREPDWQPQPCNRK